MADPAMILPLTAVLTGWMVAAGSPGPATLAISGTSMQLGRRAGLTIALGVLMGSATWGIAAALGFSAVMVANAWLFEVLRYVGAAYLMYLAVKSLRSAWRGDPVAPVTPGRQKSLFYRGVLLHLTNPKAILGWGAIYAIALAPDAGTVSVWRLFLSLVSASSVVFLGYALIFSWRPVALGYARVKRWFELTFAVLFGAASFKILTARLT